jgi:hypothetical protein
MFWIVVGVSVWVCVVVAVLWLNHSAAVLNERIDRMPL